MSNFSQNPRRPNSPKKGQGASFPGTNLPPDFDEDILLPTLPSSQNGGGPQPTSVAPSFPNKPKSGRRKAGLVPLKYIIIVVVVLVLGLGGVLLAAPAISQLGGCQQLPTNSAALALNRGGLSIVTVYESPDGSLKAIETIVSKGAPVTYYYDITSGEAHCAPITITMASGGGKYPNVQISRAGTTYTLENPGPRHPMKVK